MNIEQYNSSLFSFLQASPTPFHAVTNMSEVLLANGFHQLQENELWDLRPGNGYFITRDDGAIVTFIIGSKEKPEQGFRILGAHTDSPCLQIKPKSDIQTGSYLQLGVELYGGSLLNPWFDRDLSLAGRVCYQLAGGEAGIQLIDFKRPLLTIPSVAIHFDREANSSKTINKQTQLPPVIGQSIEKKFPDFKNILIEQCRREHPKLPIEKILSFDIFCYDCQQPTFTGLDQELISASKLDNLLSCHTGITAMIESDRTRNSLLFCANHEENGSTSTSGAQGSFLESMIERILPDVSTRHIALANSFHISMDNAHAAHPNYMDKSDSSHEILLNKGPVIKLNANQRYATNSITSAIYKLVCEEADVHPQEFVMRSDMPCGSTIGPITAARLGVKTVDVGAPTLAMHSIREHTGASDPFLLYRSVSQFLKSNVHQQSFN